MLIGGIQINDLSEESMRKRIALLTSELQDLSQSQFMEGFLKKSFENDYDVCVFTTLLKEPESALKAVGEAGIFSLINFDAFDAVVVMGDMLRASDIMIKIERALIRNFKGKVLFIEKESTKFPYIRMDHYEPMKMMVRHMIEDHNFKDIVFVGGHEWHLHTKQRTKAFIDCMTEHNLPVDEGMIYYGDFWYGGGHSAAKYFLENLEHIPQAIICANDYMARGVTEELVNRGYHIPQDIAVVGYDSVYAAQTSPQPITSVIVGNKDFGRYASVCIDHMIKGFDIPKYETVTELFHGSSCGCNLSDVRTKQYLYNSWKNIQDERNYYTSFIHLLEDITLQTSFKSLLDAIQTYSYRIREFDAFHIFLNDYWLDDNRLKNDHFQKGYTKQVIPVLNCGRSGEGADVIDFESRYNTSDMYWGLYEESDKPRSFIFSPLFFDDITFGYSVLSYGNEPKVYGDNFYLWIRSVLTGFESYRRHVIANSGNEEEFQILDPHTRMFNYEGFTKHAIPMVQRGKTSKLYTTILAIDIAGMEEINSKFGRKEGDRTIYELARIINACADESAMCCRLGNDEFIIAELTQELNQKQIHDVRRRILAMIDQYNQEPSTKFKLQIYSGSCTAYVDNLTQMENLVNQAVSRKNGNKASEQRMRNRAMLSEDEMKQAELVMRILDENMLTYYFQPIVDAKSGEIYAYEALMRSTSDKYVSPLEIIKYATVTNRLLDVERATLNNVISFVENDSESFAGKKVFINSIPGQLLPCEEATMLGNRFIQFPETFVIELTEQSEANDKMLQKMNEHYSKLGVEIAVDDYGTGYSNIVNLLRYMPDYVKIDRMLLSGIHENPQKQHFVKDIIIFAHENNIKVLAEGIEKVEELEKVIELDVDFIQGYYTAKPNPVVLDRIDANVKEEIVRFANKYMK